MNNRTKVNSTIFFRQASSLPTSFNLKSLELFQKAINGAETIVWNGPMGAFETPEFSNGTYSLVDMLCESKALTVVGGGDTDLALHNKHAFDRMSFVSTAGGAFLEMLEGKKLPGVEVLG